MKAATGTSALVAEIDALQDALRSGEGEEAHRARAASDALLALLDNGALAALKGDEAALSSLARLLDRMTGPGALLVLLELCDQLLARDLDDPIIAASAAQALLDVQADDDAARSGRGCGPVAALAVLDRHVDFGGEASAHLLTAIGMKGRAHKDLFASFRETDPARAAGHAAHAFDFFRQASAMSERIPDDDRAWLWRWPAVNAITVLGMLLDLREELGRRAAVQGAQAEAPLPEDLPDDEAARTWIEETSQALRDRIRNSLAEDAARNPKNRNPDPWNAATMAELEAVQNGDFEAAADWIAEYAEQLGKRPESGAQAAAAMIAGTLRQFERIAGDDEHLIGLRNGLRTLLLTGGGAPIRADEKMIADARGMAEGAARIADRIARAGGRLEAYQAEAQQAHPSQMLPDLADAVRATAAMVIRDTRATLGTGFAVREGDLFPNSRAPETRLLLTCAHVCSWPEDFPANTQARMSRRPEELVARFELLPGTGDFDLEPLHCGRAHLDEHHWLDCSILRIEGAGAGDLPVVKVDPDLPCAPPQRAYIPGHMGGRTQQIFFGSNGFLDWQGRPPTPERVFYEAGTAGGHSGGPVLATTLNHSLAVVAVHAGWEQHGVNYGVRLKDALDILR